MKRISENEAERKRLGGIERKRKRRAWTLPLFRRTLAVTLCAAMIAGFSLELIPANAEETGKVTEGTSAPEGNDNQGNNGDQGNGGNGSTESVAANLPATTTTSAVTTEAAKETGTVTTTQTKAAETVTTTETATETTTETTTETAKAKSENEIKVEAKCVDTDGKDIDGQNPIQIQDSIEFNSDNVPKIDGYTYEKAQIKYNDNDTVITKINVTADGGNKTYAAVVDENNSITLVEDTAVEYVYKAEDADYPAFAAEKTVGNITIHVSAEKGVLPKGTQLSVKEIATQDDKVEEAVAEKEDTVAEKVSAVAVFDITLLDKDGKEIEPASGKNVSVTFTNIKTADKKNVETKVFRMTDELDTVAKTMSADVDHQKKEVSFDTDHFTAYAIADINGSPTGSQPVSNLITSVTLNTTANPPVALDHNGSMKFNTAYLVKYNIKSPIYFGKANADLGPSGTDNYYVTPGSTYILPNLPAQIKLANGLNDFDVYTDNNLKFGKFILH